MAAIDFLDPSILAYASIALFAVVALVIVLVTSVFLHSLDRAGAGPDSHLGVVLASLQAVRESTEPIPPVVAGINQGLADLAEALRDTERHLANGRDIFNQVAEGR